MDGLIDTRDVIVDGITYHVSVSYDTDGTPYDADCYSPEDIADWKADKWHYVNVDVTPVIDGQSIDAARDSLGGVEYGFSHGWNRYIDMDEICNVHPVPNMIPEALHQLKNIAPKLIAALTDTL